MQHVIGTLPYQRSDVGYAPAASYEYVERLEYDSGRFFIRRILVKFAAFTSP